MSTKPVFQRPTDCFWHYYILFEWGKDYGHGAVSVSPLYPGAEAIGMHSTACSGLSQGSGLWGRENYTKLD